MAQAAGQVARALRRAGQRARARAARQQQREREREGEGEELHGRRGEAGAARGGGWLPADMSEIYGAGAPARGCLAPAAGSARLRGAGCGGARGWRGGAFGRAQPLVRRGVGQVTCQWGFVQDMCAPRLACGADGCGCPRVRPAAAAAFRSALRVEM